MAWVKIDDEFYDHPKWSDAPGDSVALWLAMLAWCNRNDSIEGFIPAVKCAGLITVRNLKATLLDLERREVIHPEGNGYVIHDYVEFQQPEKVREIAAKRSAAGKAGASKRWSKHKAKQMANAIANECPVPEPVTTTSSITSSRHLHGVPVRRDDFAQAITLIVEYRCQGRTMESPRAYKRTVAREAEQLDGRRVQELLDEGMTADDVAEMVLSKPTPAKQASKSMAWCSSDCPTCGGDAWIEADGGLAPCPERTKETAA
jgi:hypothetical protein